MTAIGSAMAVGGGIGSDGTGRSGGGSRGGGSPPNEATITAAAIAAQATRSSRRRQGDAWPETPVADRSRATPTPPGGWGRCRFAPAASLRPMPEQTYDLMLIIDANLDEAGRAGVSSTVDELIAKGGGTIGERSDWGERALAFEIDHVATGDYRLLRFTGPGEMVEPLNRQLNITDGLLRHRVIKAVDGTPATVGPSSDSTASVSGSQAPNPATAPTEPVVQAAPAADESPATEVSTAGQAEATDAGEPATGEAADGAGADGTAPQTAAD